VSPGCQTSFDTIEREAGRPDRHVYSLTAKGRKELRRWLLEGFAPKIQRNEFLLKLFFGEEITPKTNIAHVEQFRVLQRELLQKYGAIENRSRVTMPVIRTRLTG